MIQELIHSPAAAVTRECLCQSQGDKHDGLSEDDRHHVCGKELQGDVLACTTHGTVAFNTLGILHGYPTRSLHQHNGQSHHEEKRYNLEEELD